MHSMLVSTHPYVSDRVDVGCRFIPEKRKNRIDDSRLFDYRGFHFSLPLWTPETKFFARQRPGLRKCFLHWPVCKLSWIHHNSVHGFDGFCADPHYKPLHFEMAKGVQLN